jgi:hypothetical protein
MDPGNSSITQTSWFRVKPYIMLHVPARRVRIQETQERILNGYEDLRENFESYTLLDHASVAAGVRRTHLGGLSLSELNSICEDARSKIRVNAGISDDEYVQCFILKVLEAWPKGPISYQQIVFLAGAIIKLIGADGEYQSPNPHILFADSFNLIDKINILACWLYDNCGAFWAPENAVDVWEHLQYICDKFMRDDVLIYITKEDEFDHNQAHDKSVLSKHVWDLCTGR